MIQFDKILTSAHHDQLSRKYDHSANVEPWGGGQLSWTVVKRMCPGNKNDQTIGMYRKAGGLAASAFSFLLPHIIQSSLEGIRCWCAVNVWICELCIIW